MRVCARTRISSPLYLIFQPNSFLPEDYSHDNLSPLLLFTYLFSKVLKTGSDIKSAKVKRKAKNMEKKAYLFCLSLSNHIHNINVFLRPQGQKKEIYGNLEGDKISHLTANKESAELCCLLSVGRQAVLEKNLLAEQDKGYPQGTEVERRQRRVMGDRAKA